MHGLSDKVVIVTGGGGGIGTATCQRFAEEGAKVAVFDIDADSGGRTAALITEAGGTCIMRYFPAWSRDIAAISSTSLRMRRGGFFRRSGLRGVQGGLDRLFQDHRA